MTATEAGLKWKQAADCDANGVRTGNWQSLAHVLRHCAGGEAEEVEEVADQLGVIRVTVAKENARAPFLLVVE